MDKWRSGNNNLESRESTAGIQTRCSWHVRWGSGLQNWDWRKRRCIHVTNFEWNWLDLIGCRTDVCCDSWTALHRRGFRAKLRENVANFPAMEPVLLGAAFEIPENNHRSGIVIETAERERKCIEQHFREDQAVWERRNDEALSRRREGICHCDKLEQSKFFHASCDPFKRIATESHANQKFLSNKKKSKRKAVLKLAERELLLKDQFRFHNESAELDLSKTRKLSKKSRGFPLPLGDNLESVEEWGADQLREQ